MNKIVEKFDDKTNDEKFDESINDVINLNINFKIRNDVIRLSYKKRIQIKTLNHHDMFSIVRISHFINFSYFIV